jgi:ABC-type transport system substrate-binding protein
MYKYTLKSYLESFSRLEKFIATILIYAMTFSSLGLAYDYYKTATKLVNIPGGVYTEGIVGSVEYLDPINAKNSLEKELSHLIYRGLLKYNPLSEDFEPDIATSYEISEDGLKYSFRIKSDVEFHNNEKLSVDDIIGTYNLVKGQGPYQGIEISKISSNRLDITIPNKDAFFVKHFTLGILQATSFNSENIYQEIKDVSYSRKPIGTGDFKVSDVVHKASEDIITLIPTGKTRIPKLKIHTFETKEQLKSQLKYLSAVRSVDEDLRRELELESWNMHNLRVPRYAVLFFDNITEAPTFEPKFRLGLKYAINKEALSNAVPHTEVMNFPLSHFDSQVISYNKDNSANLLFESGWGIYDDDNESLRRNKDRVPLVLDLVTSQNNDFIRAANELKKQFADIGITINIKAQKTQDLRDTIESREFQLLLLGQDMGLDEDFRFYFHSSQAAAPGLNFSQYKRPEADVLMTKISQTHSRPEREKLLEELQGQINNDVPLVFLYRTFDVYATAPDIHAAFPEKVGSLENRFSMFSEWMTATKRIKK